MVDILNNFSNFAYLKFHLACDVTIAIKTHPILGEAMDF